MADAVETSETEWHERFNPGGVVYGVLAIATVIAAESTRRETFAKLLAGSLVALALYWAAHAYSHHWASRLTRAGEWSLNELGVSLAYEASILAGAVVPTAVLVIAWLAGADIQSGVTAVLWSAGVELVVLEIAAGLRRRCSIRDLAVQTAIGLSMGLGILGLRILLH